MIAIYFSLINFNSPQHFGEITKNILDENVPYLILAYSTRINAEQALARGRQFKDKVLTVRKI
jgi:RNA-binding protein 26